MKVLLNCSDTSLKVCFKSPYFLITRHSFQLFHSSELSALLHHYAHWTHVIVDNCWDHLHENTAQHKITKLQKHFKILYKNDNLNILSIYFRSFDPLTKIAKHCVAIFVSRSEDLILVRLYIYLFLYICNIYYSKQEAHCDSECTYRSKYPKSYNNFGKI